MIFLFPRWDMLISWRVYISTLKINYCTLLHPDNFNGARPTQQISLVKDIVPRTTKWYKRPMRAPGRCISPSQNWERFCIKVELRISNPPFITIGWKQKDPKQNLLWDFSEELLPIEFAKKVHTVHQEEGKMRNIPHPPKKRVVVCIRPVEAAGCNVEGYWPLLMTKMISSDTWITKKKLLRAKIA